MPDGETREVSVAPGATVAALRAELNAPDDWVLGFNGSVLDGGEELGKYNIPDAYDHAGGLLKMIDGSGLGLEGKVQALDKALKVVQGISRGERDMDRIINAALRDDGENGGGGGENGEQPSLKNARRDTASISFSNLLPPGVSQINFDKAPPTPSQLLRRLGSQFPTLYPPKAQDKMEAELMREADGARAMGAASRLAVSAKEREDKEAECEGEGAIGGEDKPGESCGQLKRGATWFEDVMKSLNPGGGENAGGSAAGNNAEQVGGGVGASATAAGSGGGGKDVGQSSDEELEPDEDDDDFGMSEGESEAPSAMVNGDGSGTGAASTALGRTANSHDTGESVTSKDTQDRRRADGDGSGAEDGHGESCAEGGKHGGSIAGGPGNNIDGSGLLVKIPKKRGRKRKNPELSEDQRKALRQAQNRESAKQSRLRRKTQTAEYEQRVTTLCTENESLRDTISALSDRLHFLQGLLTVSVTTQRPSGAPPVAGSTLPPIPNPMLMHGAIPLPVPVGTVPIALPPAQMAAAAAAARGGFVPPQPRPNQGNYASRPPGL